MRFAVACTSHVIDHIGLDNTRLSIIEAKSPEGAAKESIIKGLLEIDEDRRVDAKGQYEDMADESVGLTADVLKLPKQTFKQTREEYWRKNIKLEKQPGWDFFLDLQDYTGCVYGFKVLQIK